MAIMNIVLILFVSISIVAGANITATTAPANVTTLAPVSKNATNPTTPKVMVSTTAPVSTATKKVANVTTPAATTQAPLTKGNGTMTTVGPMTHKTTQAPPCNDPKCPIYSFCDNTTKRCVCPSKSPLQIEVCGTDGKTYSSIQSLEAYACNMGKNIKKESNGKCDGDDRSNKKTVIIVVVVLLLVFVFVVVGVFIYRRSRQGGTKMNEEKSKDNLL